MIAPSPAAAPAARPAVRALRAAVTTATSIATTGHPRTWPVFVSAAPCALVVPVRVGRAQATTIVVAVAVAIPISAPISVAPALVAVIALVVMAPAPTAVLVAAVVDDSGNHILQRLGRLGRGVDGRLHHFAQGLPRQLVVGLALAISGGVGPARRAPTLRWAAS